MGTHTHRGRRGAPPLHSVGDIVEQALEKALERRRQIARIKLMIAPEPPPSHPLRGSSVEADDLLLEIARWLSPADAWALGCCARRFHSLASFSEALFPWRWRWRHLIFESLKASMHVHRWRAHLVRWRERALHRAERITVSARIVVWSDAGLFAVPLIEAEREAERSRLFFRLRRRTKMRKLLIAAAERLAWVNVHPRRLLLIRAPQLLAVHLCWPDDNSTHGRSLRPFDSRRSFPVDLVESEEIRLVADVRTTIDDLRGEQLANDTHNDVASLGNLLWPRLPIGHEMLQHPAPWPLETPLPLPLQTTG
jgi:hypothetical protein